MSHEQAAEALFEAIQSDTGRIEHGDPGQMAQVQEPAPVVEENKPEEVESATPQGTEDGATQAEEVEDSFTKLDPNSLPEELQPYYKSLQGDYTRKTQQLAERAKQFETFGDLEQVQNAVNLFQAIQTPEGAVQFHQELSATLQQLGLTPAQAAAEATRQMEEGAQAISFEDDPEAALKAELDSVRSEFSNLRAELEAERAAARQEQEMLAMAGEFQRQESLIRDANPHYDQTDIDAIYELSSFHGGNLLAAQERYEEVVSSRIARLLNEKASVAGNQAIQPTGSSSAHAEQAPGFSNLEEAHRAAVEYLRQVEAQS